MSNLSRILFALPAFLSLLCADVASAKPQAVTEIESARQALAADPASPAPAVALGRALSRLGATDQALLAYAEARRRAPDLIEAYLLPALLLRDAGEEQSALDLVRDGLERAPDAVPLLAEKAGLQLRRGLAARAAATAQEAIERVGEAPELLQALGLALAADPELRDEAEAPLRRALELEADGPVAVRLTLGELAIERGAFDEAVELLNAASASHPDVPAVAFRRATALRLAGREAEAEEAMARSRVLRSADEQAEAQAREHGTTLNRAQELASSNQLDAALREVERALQQAPDSDRAWALKAKILFSMERIAAALEAIDRARDAAPQRVEYHYLAGAFRRSTGDFGGAVGALKAAITLEPRLGEAHALLGGIALQQQRFDDAAQHLQTAIDVGLSTGDVHAAYAQVLSQLGRGAESAEQWRLSREARARAGKG
ncbi:MAG: tetratricopeptide repeat protein [Acidobacteriota bacterium]